MTKKQKACLDRWGVKYNPHMSVEQASQLIKDKYAERGDQMQADYYSRRTYYQAVELDRNDGLEMYMDDYYNFGDFC